MSYCKFEGSYHVFSRSLLGRERMGDRSGNQSRRIGIMCRHYLLNMSRFVMYTTEEGRPSGGESGGVRWIFCR